VTANISEPSPTKAITANRYWTRDTRKRPLAGRWYEPGCSTDYTDTDDFYIECKGDEPPLENSWLQMTNASGLEKFAFRLHMDGSLEFRGHLDASGGAVSGSVAVTLPGAIDPSSTEPARADFRPPNDQFFLTVITDDSGATFQAALVKVEAATGEVTITWPIS
jgi:hypothetical protein